MATTTFLHTVNADNTSMTPVFAENIQGFNIVDMPAFPNSTPASYNIVFQMTNGLTYTWTYSVEASRDADFATILATISTAV